MPISEVEHSQSLMQHITHVTVAVWTICRAGRTDTADFTEPMFIVTSSEAEIIEDRMHVVESPASVDVDISDRRFVVEQSIFPKLE